MWVQVRSVTERHRLLHHADREGRKPLWGVVHGRRPMATERLGGQHQLARALVEHIEELPRPHARRGVERGLGGEEPLALLRRVDGDEALRLSALEGEDAGLACHILERVAVVDGTCDVGVDDDQPLGREAARLIALEAPDDADGGRGVDVQHVGQVAGVEGSSVDGDPSAEHVEGGAHGPGGVVDAAQVAGLGPGLARRLGHEDAGEVESGGQPLVLDAGGVPHHRHRGEAGLAHRVELVDLERRRRDHGAEAAEDALLADVRGAGGLDGALNVGQLAIVLRPEHRALAPEHHLVLDVVVVEVDLGHHLADLLRAGGVALHLDASLAVRCVHLLLQDHDLAVHLLGVGVRLRVDGDDVAPLACLELERVRLGRQGDSWRAARWPGVHRLHLLHLLHLRRLVDVVDQVDARCTRRVLERRVLSQNLHTHLATGGTTVGETLGAGHRGESQSDGCLRVCERWQGDATTNAVVH